MLFNLLCKTILLQQQFFQPLNVGRLFASQTSKRFFCGRNFDKLFCKLFLSDKL